MPTSAEPAIPAVPSHWRFPAEARSVGRARRAVVEALPPPIRPYLGDDLLLIASELVGNAVRHGALAPEQSVELVLWPADGHYWIAVSDTGRGTPRPVAAATDACGGRGLLLVSALSAAWAVVPRPVAGKSVVAGLRLPGGRP